MKRGQTVRKTVPGTGLGFKADDHQVARSRCGCPLLPSRGPDVPKLNGASSGK